ncbi:MAG TPA: hypothetical protein VHH73_01290 [Verrucomicrobiae bacterium]|nr:hypothetical protein [Verrucomicrobiae bacterium]
MKHRSLAWPLALLLSCAVPDAFSQPGKPDQPVYRKGGFSSMIAMGKALFKTLKPAFKEQVHFQPVSLETDVMPYVRLEEYKDPDVPKPMRMVFISVGFIDLVNYVAHAKAIDKVEKGFFDKYVLSLGQESGEKGLKELPRLSDPKFWTEDMMNEQESSFNQMCGILLATELSHHYLGHYKKYADKLMDANGKPVPINSLLTEAEWKDSLKAGTINALNCGYGIDGIKSLFDAIEKMPQRPAWTTYFLPKFANVKQVKKDLKRLEDNFFAGNEL